MKKTVFLAIICIALLSVFVFPASASSATERVPISSQISSELRSLLNNKELYNDSMKGITVGDQPIITVYNNVFWRYCEFSLEDRIKKIEAEEVWKPSYILLNSSVRIQPVQKEDGQTSILVRETFTSNTLPTYVKDFASSDKNSCTILGESRTIANVICFDGRSSHAGTAVYYVTDTNEVFVRYYNSYNAPAAEFTLADYQHYGVIYYNYITSDEANYDENGNLLVGSFPFTTFIQSEEMLNGEYHHYGRDYYRDPPKPEFPIATVSTVAAVVLWALVVVLLIIRKKKGTKKASNQ